MAKINESTAPNQTPESRGKRLKQLRLMAGFATRQAVDVRFNISTNTLSSWEDGKRGGLTSKGALRVIYAMREAGWYCTRDWLLYGDGLGPRPLDETLAGNTNIETALDTDEETAIRNELLTFRKYNLDAIDMKVTDDGMGHHYSIGDYIGGQRQFGENISQCVNYDCIVETTTDEFFFRRLRAGSTSDVYTLYCMNPNATVHELIINDIALKSAAPVIWHRTKRKP